MLHGKKDRSHITYCSWLQELIKTEFIEEHYRLSNIIDENNSSGSRKRDDLLPIYLYVF